MIGVVVIRFEKECVAKKEETIERKNVEQIDKMRKVSGEKRS